MVSSWFCFHWFASWDRSLISQSMEDWLLELGSFWVFFFFFFFWLSLVLLTLWPDLLQVNISMNKYFADFLMSWLYWATGLGNYMLSFSFFPQPIHQFLLFCLEFGKHILQPALFHPSQNIIIDNIIYFYRFYFDPQCFILYNLILIEGQLLMNI